jgi:hypothetical protein
LIRGHEGRRSPNAANDPLSLPFANRFGVSRVAATASFIVAVMALAFRLRVAGLSTYGFSEDDINKVRAIEQYRRGVPPANAEHPILMKLGMFTSVAATRGVGLPMETAVRPPNAVVRAATTSVLFGAMQLLFGTAVAMMAAPIRLAHSVGTPAATTHLV